MVNFYFKPIGKSGKYGIYVRSVSNMALYLLHWKFPELHPDKYAIASDIGGKITIIKGALRVSSDRYKRKNTKQAASAEVIRLNSLTDPEQVALVERLAMKIIDKDYVYAKMQYFRLHRDFMGSEMLQMSTQDKVNATAIMAHLSERGIKARLQPTVARTRKYTKTEFELINAIGQQVHTHSVQGPKDMVHGSKRKRNTTVSFWKSK